MNDPSSPMGWHVWRRGSLLGMQWLAVFVVVTLLLYLLLGVIGWSGIARAMCAMFSGPVIGMAVIAAWWIARRPAVAPEMHTEAEGEGIAAMNELELNQYYTALAAKFNAAAQHYDLQCGPPSGSNPGNPLLTWLREEHMALLCDLLPDGGAVIDLGCGTGIETLALAQAGYQVLGVDVCSGMVRQAQIKAAAFGIKGQTTFKVLPAGHLNTVSDRGPYHGAFASLGTLNTEPQLDKLAEALHDLLVPGAPFVATVMSRHCWFEIRHNLRRFKPGATMKRGGTWREGRAGTGGVTAPVTFYQPEAFAEHFAPHFTVESVIAFPLLLPPVHMVDLYRERAEKFEARLDEERAMRGRKGWRAWGDHFLMVLRHDD